jgi:hypothetical protein
MGLTEHPSHKGVRLMPDVTPTPPVMCPDCGAPTTTTGNPMLFLCPDRPVLRHCTNPGRPGALWDACPWQRTEAAR